MTFKMCTKQFTLCDEYRFHPREGWGCSGCSRSAAWKYAAGVTVIKVLHWRREAQRRSRVRAGRRPASVFHAAKTGETQHWHFKLTLIELGECGDALNFKGLINLKLSIRTKRGGDVREQVIGGGENILSSRRFARWQTPDLQQVMMEN